MLDPQIDKTYLNICFDVLLFPNQFQTNRFPIFDPWTTQIRQKRTRAVRFHTLPDLFLELSSGIDFESSWALFSWSLFWNGLGIHFRIRKDTCAWTPSKVLFNLCGAIIVA
jgi:hypothetical protein